MTDPTRNTRSLSPFEAASLCAAAAGILLASACSSGEGRGGPPEAPVSAAAAETRDIPVEVRSIGTVEAWSTVEVTSRVGGQLVAVHVLEGEEVRKGEPLFTIDERPYRAALLQAEANLARDRSRAENARRDAERYAGLVEKDYVTKAQYDEKRSEADALEAAVRADEAAVENARLDLAYCRIASPIDGRTGSLLVHEGNLVKASGDKPLMVVHQVRPIRVAFTVPQGGLPELRRSVREEKALQVTAEGDGGPWTGALSFVDNAVDPATGTVTLKAEFPNADGSLWPGQFVDVGLILGTLKNAVVVPSQAVQMGQQGDFVFVVKGDSTVEVRPVVRGPDSNGFTALESGVREGETVVTDGHLRLFPGARVDVKSGGAPGGGGP